MFFRLSSDACLKKGHSSKNGCKIAQMEASYPVKTALDLEQGPIFRSKHPPESYPLKIIVNLKLPGNRSDVNQ